VEKYPRRRLRSYTLLLHLLVWVAFLLIPLIFIESATGRERFMILGWFQQLLMAVYFYYNFLWLVPRFLLRRRGWRYAGMLLLGLVAISMMNVLFARYAMPALQMLPPHRHHGFDFWRTATFPLYPAILAFALSSALRLMMEWLKTERERQDMESEKLTSELAFLKSQINPHFLFNTLNNICSLARKKSDSTEEAIIRLSQIMRYMLQDSKDEKVSLAREVEYLQSYIELQKMRLPGQVKVDFTVEGNPELVSIEPLLLIPFVENAFKHGVSYQEESEIGIRLACTGNSVAFHVINRVVRSQGERIEQGSGIGLKNVMRRLELLYPGRHRLEALESENRYIVELEITLR